MSKPRYLRPANGRRQVVAARVTVETRCAITEAAKEQGVTPGAIIGGLLESWAASASV